MSAPIRILVVDDHPVVRDGLLGMLSGPDDLEAVGEAADGHEAVLAVQRLDPDVVLMDLQMPNVDGIAATRSIATEHPQVRVLVLTTYDDAPGIRTALAAGAAGYVLKDTPRDDLYAAIRHVASGGTALSPSAASSLVTNPAPPVELTDREIEILSHIAEGGANRDVAKALHISEATVKTHLIHIYDKLGVSDRTAAVTTALRAGIIRLDPTS